MKKISKLVASSALTLGLLTVFATQVKAQVSATNNATTTVNCTAGDYGQNNCYSITNQSNTQVLGSRTNLRHVVVDTAVDPTLMTAGTVTMITSAIGAVITLKKKVS